MYKISRSSVSAWTDGSFRWRRSHSLPLVCYSGSVWLCLSLFLCLSLLLWPVHLYTTVVLVYICFYVIVISLSQSVSLSVCVSLYHLSLLVVPVPLRLDMIHAVDRAFKPGNLSVCQSVCFCLCLSVTPPPPSATVVSAR